MNSNVIESNLNVTYSIHDDTIKIDIIFYLRGNLMNITPISLDALPQCLEKFASDVPEYGMPLKKFVINANEAYFQRNEINLGLSMRLCAEQLCKTYLLSYNKPGNMDLAKMIEYLPSSGLISQEDCNLLDAMRKAGNSSAHTSYESYLDLYKIYEDFYCKIDTFIFVAYEFNTSENPPTLRTGHEPNPARFVDYAESVIKMYRMRAICFYLCVFVVFLCLYSIFRTLFGVRKYGDDIKGNLIVLLIFALMLLWLTKVKKAYSPAASYRNDQVKYNYGIKYMNDWIFAGHKQTIDFGYSWEDLHKYH